MKKKEIISRVVEIIRRYQGGEYKIFLFGSWAKGTAVDTSDMDIALLGPQEIDRDTMIAIKQEIEKIPTLRGIDIVDLQAASVDFRNNVLAHAQPIE